MIKKLLLYPAVFILLFFTGFYLHNLYLTQKEVLLPFSLEKVYQFHATFSALICINFLLLSTVNKIFDQLGFIYLGTFFLKIGLFCVVFYSSIVTNENLEKTAKITLLIPTFIFLLTEVIFVAKILNQKDSKKIL